MHTAWGLARGIPGLGAAEYDGLASQACSTLRALRIVSLFLR